MSITTSGHSIHIKEKEPEQNNNLLFCIHYLIFRLIFHYNVYTQDTNIRMPLNHLEENLCMLLSDHVLRHTESLLKI